MCIVFHRNNCHGQIAIDSCIRCLLRAISDITANTYLLRLTQRFLYSESISLHGSIRAGVSIVLNNSVSSHLSLMQLCHCGRQAEAHTRAASAFADAMGFSRTRPASRL